MGQDVHSSVLAVTARIETDKPVRKTPYQVKGVIIKEFPDEPIIPFINGAYRNSFLYPRVQVKVLNEQIYLVGIKEGIEAIQSLLRKLKSLNFGNITFEVKGTSFQLEKDRFKAVSHMIRYRFLTPWIALNPANMSRFKSIYGQERVKYLSRLLSQNIIFLAKELNQPPKTNIYSKLHLRSFQPRLVEDGQMGAFEGDFCTNYVLPNFLGIGNGITKGYGAIFSHFDPSHFTFDEQTVNVKNGQDHSIVEPLPENWEKESVTSHDIPKSRKRKKSSIEPTKEPNYNTLEYHRRTHH